MSDVAPQELSRNPLVSISIITYNHKDFIADAIESVLMQKVDFEYEIIIGDDFSNDGTQEILNEYQQKYPDKIQLILHPRDYDCVPGRINNITNIYACRGKYIAMLDGDDRWVSADKLQKQADFLEENEDFALSFHEMLLCYSKDKVIPYSSRFPTLRQDNTIFSIQDVMQGWFIQTSSMMYRSKLIGEFPEWFWNIYSADYAIQLLVTRYGKIKYFPDIRAWRNYHPHSFTATQNTTHVQIERRQREHGIFGKVFPGYTEYRDYNQAKLKFKSAARHLKGMRFKEFSSALSGSARYGGRFISGKGMGAFQKLDLLKKSFTKLSKQ